MAELITDNDTFTVTWTEISTHEVQLTALELANLLGVGVFDLNEGADLTDGPEDALAELDDDGFDGLTRESIEVIRHR